MKLSLKPLNHPQKEKGEKFLDNFLYSWMAFFQENPKLSPNGTHHDENLYSVLDQISKLMMPKNKLRYFNRTLKFLFLILIFQLAISILPSRGLLACDVPVFRYALERWPVDPYEAIAVESQPFSSAEKKALDELREDVRKGKLNLSLKVMKLKDFTNSRYQRALSNEVRANSLHLFYPQASGLSRVVWSGPITQKSVEKVSECKNRKLLVKDLLDGSSAVFVLIESGDPEKDNEAKLKLTKRLKELGKAIKLPEKVAEVEDKKKVEDPINKLKSKIQFKIDFKLLVITRDEAEGESGVLAGSLLGLESDLVDLRDEPMVFTIYGRGRALAPLIGQGINQRMIDQIAYFVTGACSCQIKNQNPGTDLLIMQDWGKAVLGVEAK